MARKNFEPYSVTGPGLDLPPAYESPGAALSRSLTAALAWHGEGTWYVREGKAETILGHSSRDEHGRVESRWT